MSEAAATGIPQSTTARAVVWRVLVGTASGAIAGFLVGGIGGRLAMLLLRVTSPESVNGLTSDDGFEIGVVSGQTFNLLLATTGLGAVAGAFYAGVRGAIPARLRLPLWIGFWALVGGAGIVHEDGVDFTAVGPASLAIALFVALPAIGAAVMVLLTERWSKATPWQSRRLTVGLALAAAAATIALLVAVFVTAVMLVVYAVLEPLGARADGIRRAARVVVPLVLVALAALAATDLIPESSSLIG